jgi:sugar lactone lactonase YvrE
MLCPIISAGCSKPATPLLAGSDPPQVWPKKPDEPRLRLLGEITGSEDLGASKSAARFWDELFHGPRPPSRLITPHAVAVNDDGQRVAVADTNGKCVHVFDLQRRQYRRLEICDADGTRFECPVGVAWSGDTLYAADSKLHAVAVIGAAGPASRIGTEQLQHPAGLACSPGGDLIYVSDSTQHTVWAFRPDGEPAFSFGSRGSGPGQFNYPSQLVCAPDGTVVVADSLNFRIQRFTADGKPLGVFGRKGDAAGDFALPKGVAVSPEGYLWVVDAQFENVQGFTPDGELLLAFGGEGQAPGEFWLPAGICIDAQRRMWVADTYNRRVQVFELFE